MTGVDALARIVRESRGLAHKADIAPVMRRLGIGAGDPVAVGDDTAVIPDGDSHLLLAIEGFVENFVTADPWFAGYCGIMVNVSDIMAMGGRPIAVVDALWSENEAAAAPLLAGMRDAARRYGVPVVGGHSNLRASGGQLAVAILGRADYPVTSFGAQPGDAVLVATDLRGIFRDPFPWWDASTDAPEARLRAGMEVMPTLAEEGLLTAAKDISMAGVVGTAIMLAEASRVGMAIHVDALPCPAHVPVKRWLTAFPSFGFVMTARPGDAERVIARFAAAGVACAEVGRASASEAVTIEYAGKNALVWHRGAPLIGCHAPSDHGQEKVDA
jgi:AIR synthase-related protein